MFPLLHGRVGHYLLLGAVWALLSLPNLGAPSLWDVDEAHNAEAGREMLESGNWITPTFNYQLRVDKPALLYWLQMTAYEYFGVSEFAARLPSALAALLALFATYELGRLLFGAAAGLLAGLVLASSLLFAAAAHFANPDALLNAFTLLNLLCFWRGFVRPWVGWYALAGACAGLAFMTKGPVGLVLPLATACLFLLVARRLGWLFDRRMLAAAFACATVAVPWYALVGAETKGDFLRGFFLTHNVNRFLSPMENHAGPVWYYAAALLLGFVPWSVFFLPALWNAWTRRWNVEDSRVDEALGDSARQEPRSPSETEYSGLASRFLACWMVVWLLFFSLSRTKLPNYILPVFPAAALWTAWYLDGWRRGRIRPPRWLTAACLGSVALLGLGLAAVCIGATALGFPRLNGGEIPGLASWALLGLAPLVGAALAGWFVRRQRHALALNSLVAAAVVLVGCIAALATTMLEECKAPRLLVQAAGARQTNRDVRVGCYRWYQPSLVFYCRREVSRFFAEDEARAFLEYPLPVYLFLPESVWQELEPRLAIPCRLLARQHDFYRHCDVVVITNQ